MAGILQYTTRTLSCQSNIGKLRGRKIGWQCLSGHSQIISGHSQIICHLPHNRLVQSRIFTCQILGYIFTNENKSPRYYRESDWLTGFALPSSTSFLQGNTPHCTGSTIALTKGSLSPSLSTQLIVRLIFWSADARRDRILLTFRSSESRKETPTRTCYLLAIPAFVNRSGRTTVRDRARVQRSTEWLTKAIVNPVR